MSYERTQKSPLSDILLGIAVAILGAVMAYSPELVPMLIAAAVALSLAFAALCFGSLTVRDEGEHLAARFGPLPVFWTRVKYSDITSAEPDRSILIDGWGMHYIPGRGRIYNVWGFDCVKLQLGKKVVRIGTDDVTGLVEFLRTKNQSSEAGTES